MRTTPGWQGWMFDQPGQRPSLNPGRATRMAPIEQAAPWRAAFEIATGRYPSFVFGGRLTRSVPVFHLHDTTPAILEGYFGHLVDNGYRTITPDILGRFIRDDVYPGERRVMLCFDDAWASVWTVAYPLLVRFGLTAVTFAIPFRTAEAGAPRPFATGAGPDDGSPAFATWPELQALASSGVVDVQSHSWSHAAITTSNDVLGFVTPHGPVRQPLEWPWVGTGARARFLSRDDLGAPLYRERSRLTDGWRAIDRGALAACLDEVGAGGGPAFFDRPDWRQRLGAIVRRYPATFESDADRDVAIHEELGRSREELEHRLGTPVRHCCFPWGIAGARALAALPACGYQTACADRWGGRRVAAAGASPFHIMRLNERFIYALPGRGRRSFLAVART